MPELAPELNQENRRRYLRQGLHSLLMALLDAGDLSQEDLQDLTKRFSAKAVGQAADFLKKIEEARGKMPPAEQGK